MTFDELTQAKSLPDQPLYHPKDAAALLGVTQYMAWNDRCLDEAGKPYPWSDGELWRALEDAVDKAPSYGVWLLEQAQEKEFARWSAASFIEVLTHLPEPTKPIWIKPDALYGAFLDFSGVNPQSFDRSELGLEITHAIDQGRLPFVERDRTNADGRIYRGLDLNTLRIAIDTYEQRRQSFNAAS